MLIMNHESEWCWWELATWHKHVCFKLILTFIYTNWGMSQKISAIIPWCEQAGSQRTLFKDLKNWDPGSQIWRIKIRVFMFWGRHQHHRFTILPTASYANDSLITSFILIIFKQTLLSFDISYNMSVRITEI